MITIRSIRPVVSLTAGLERYRPSKNKADQPIHLAPWSFNNTIIFNRIACSDPAGLLPRLQWLPRLALARPSRSESAGRPTNPRLSLNKLNSPTQPQSVAGLQVSFTPARPPPPTRLELAQPTPARSTPLSPRHRPPWLAKAAGPHAPLRPRPRPS